MILYRTAGYYSDLLDPFLVRHASSYPERGGEILTEPNGDQGGEDDPKAGNRDKRLALTRRVW